MKTKYEKPVLKLLVGSDAAFGMTTISAAAPSKLRTDCKPIMQVGKPEKPQSEEKS